MIGLITEILFQENVDAMKAERIGLFLLTDHGHEILDDLDRSKQPYILQLDVLGFSRIERSCKST